MTATRCESRLFRLLPRCVFRAREDARHSRPLRERSGALRTATRATVRYAAAQPPLQRNERVHDRKGPIGKCLTHGSWLAHLGPPRWAITPKPAIGNNRADTPLSTTRVSAVSQIKVAADLTPAVPIRDVRGGMNPVRAEVAPKPDNKERRAVSQHRGRAGERAGRNLLPMRQPVGTVVARDVVPERAIGAPRNDVHLWAGRPARARPAREDARTDRGPVCQPAR